MPATPLKLAKPVDWLTKWGLGFLAEFLRGLLADLRRERDLKQSGYDEAVQQAHHEADDRKEAADVALDNWNSLDDAGRERVRLERGHYRPASDRAPGDTTER